MKRCSFDFNIKDMYPIAFCTMKYSMDLPNINKSHANKNKYPRLEELYVYLFEKDVPITLHRAENDVHILYECYKKLINYK